MPRLTRWGVIVPAAQAPFRAEPATAPGAEGSYRDGFGDCASPEEFYASVDDLLERTSCR